MISASPLSLAIGASLALHGAAFTALQELPGGWQLGEPRDARVESVALRATLKAPDVPVQPVPAVRGKPAPRAMAATPTQPVQQTTPGAEPTLGVGPVYYPAHLLDERPQVRTHVEPRFPDTAPVPGGRVVLHLFINEQGTVDEVAIVESDPPGLFEAAAAEAFGPALFRPGYKAGAAVKSRVAIEVLFGAPVPSAVPVAVNGGQYE